MAQRQEIPWLWEMATKKMWISQEIVIDEIRNTALGYGAVGQLLYLGSLLPQGANIYHFPSIFPIYLSIYYRICWYISANNGIALHFCHIRVQPLSQVDTNSWYKIRGTTVYFISAYIITFGVLRVNIESKWILIFYQKYL